MSRKAKCLCMARRGDHTTGWESFHHRTRKGRSPKASAEYLSFIFPLWLSQQNSMWSKKVAKQSELHTANVWGRMVALRMCWRRNQDLMALHLLTLSWRCEKLSSVYLKFTLWLHPNITGLDLLTIHDYLN